MATALQISRLSGGAQSLVDASLNPYSSALLLVIQSIFTNRASDNIFTTQVNYKIYKSAAIASRYPSAVAAPKFLVTTKLVVAAVTNPNFEISLEDAQLVDAGYELGDTFTVPEEQQVYFEIPNTVLLTDVNLTIASINTTLSAFVVAGDQRIIFPAAQEFLVADSPATDNNGTYEVISSTFDGVNTSIVVASIASSLAGGVIKIDNDGDSASNMLANKIFLNTLASFQLTITEYP